MSSTLSPRLPWELANPKYAAALNPIIANPLNNAQLLPSFTLKAGVNVINHLLSGKMQGYYVVDLDAPVTVYRSAPLNNLTLTLTSSGQANITLAVF